MKNYTKEDIIEIILAYLINTPERYEYLIDVIAEALGMNGEDLQEMIDK
jgi:hypothetical protein